MRKRIKFVKVIEHILVALPLIYVGATSLYTIFNKNAKDSYYGETINQYEDIYLDSDDLNTDTYYYFDTNIYTLFSTEKYIVNVSSVDLVNRGNVYDNQLSNFDNVNKIMLYVGTNDIPRIDLYNGNTFIAWFPLNNTSLNYNFVIGFNYVGKVSTYYIDDVFYYREYNSYSFLNNALPCAMSEFNKFGFNQIRFVQPFLNLFHIGETNVYIEFINNYINYFLFVECVYFTPMVLYWFIHFGEKIVNKLLDNEGGLQ